MSMRFPRQEYWSRLPFPSPGDLPDPGVDPEFPALQAFFFFFTTEPPEKARECPTSSLILCLSHLPQKVYESKTFTCPVHHSIPSFWKRLWYLLGAKSTWQGVRWFGWHFQQWATLTHSPIFLNLLPSPVKRNNNTYLTEYLWRSLKQWS